ncbi:SLATT domain-containing protein [Microbispora amethystogenes]|uniref:SLATT domain-containing protein n=1 Tax=Microbispora amethystogenes TaxID=1427754 RepID=UPI0033CF0DD9
MPDETTGQHPDRPGSSGPERRSGPFARRRQRDLGTRPFPLLTPEEWREPGDALRRMYENAQARAMETADWYLDDRVRMRLASQVLRGLAILLAAAGGLQPLAAAAGGTAGAQLGGGNLAWGYVLLAGAGVCVALDRILGLSSRWMRDITTAQKIQQRLVDFQFDWADLNARDAMGPGPVPVHDYLALLRAFLSDVSSITQEETSEWVNEFQSAVAQLTNHSGNR